MCYNLATNNDDFLLGCDLAEKDTLDLLWNDFPFASIIQINKQKYIQDYGRVKAKIFDNLLSGLSDIA